LPDFFLRSAQTEGSPDRTAARILPTFAPDPSAAATIDLEAAPAPASPAEDSPTLYTPDLPAGPDALGKDDVLTPVAQLLALRRTAPPLTVGLFGRRGTGKSFAFETLLRHVRELAAAAAEFGASSPFLSRIVTVRVEVVRSIGDPGTAIAAAIFRTLNSAGTAGESYAALAQEAVQAVRDPYLAANEANERLSASRHRLDAERQALHELDGRRAKLVETVLYETAGSHVDSYARANRSRIEARLRSFGFSQADPLGTYRDLVRDVAEAGGASGRISGFLRALWAYRGQTRLLVLAVILLFLAWGCARAGATQASWLPSLSASGGFGAALASWLDVRHSWLGTISVAATLVACLSVVACGWRALRFTQPIFRGASLLGLDLETRRRDLDGLIANQTRHLDMVAAEVEAHGRRVEEAERRARTASDAALHRGAPLFESPFEWAQDEIDQRTRLATAFTAAIDTAIARGAAGTFAVPQRILVAIDDLDSLPAERAASFIEAAHHLLSAPSFVVLLAFDAHRLAASQRGADYADALRKYVQLPLRVSSEPDFYAGFTRMLLGETKAETIPSKPDASQSILDLPWRAGESDLIAVLAPLAGSTPRAVKHFVNIYRLARVRSADYAAVALLLAVRSGATEAERKAMEEALANIEPTAPLRFGDAPRLTSALDACQTACGRALNVEDLVAAQRIVAAYAI
jgi:hypothetical protein